MADLVRILPSFPTGNFSGLLPTIENHSLTTADLLTLHPGDIAKQTRLPILDLKRLVAAIQACLSDDVGPPKKLTSPPVPPPPPPLSTIAPSLRPPSSLISTLDPDLDAALGGGVPTGRITEFVGESGVGKTQFLLSLSLAVQLPSPHGLSRSALYISTESGLPTTRLVQMLRTNPTLVAASSSPHQDGRPSSDNIRCTVLADLESQDHILQYQLPVLIDRHDVGLVVIDSVAANYRAEFERHDGQEAQPAPSRGSNMAARSADLVRLGALLRDLARRHNLAVVVANQVSDRFSSPYPSSFLPRPASYPYATQETPLASRGTRMPSSSISSSMGMDATPFFMPPAEDPPPPPVLALDHQQRWFTGWGDDPTDGLPPKNPSLGLVWTTQIACRVALFKSPVYGQPRRIAPRVTTGDDDGGGGDDNDGCSHAAEAAAPTLRTWKRWMKVVFAPHTRASGKGTDGAVRFDITPSGLRAVK
ncbi:DNA repair protein RAD57 [Geosmithia morbida]|uniref:DNA repair protein RAD57 n=1 Tax=Geosmithia morbida TaxID=1094350 RepID=A0A9P4YXM0_9HYPO|nr:DNA repair protein RAD57 [Geosmithia morbida]KAF4123611.1 DNA repair protein RAD57 [Geosmithia morbida]